jgi:hypothetical protein
MAALALGVALLAAGLGGCGEADRTTLPDGTYTPTRVCFGGGCADYEETGGSAGLTMELFRSERRVVFWPAGGARIEASFTFAPQSDWPADCYTTTHGSIPMEVALLDRPLDLVGAHFDTPVLIRQCSDTDPPRVTLVDTASPPYEQWFCSAGSDCIAFIR